VNKTNRQHREYTDERDDRNDAELNQRNHVFNMTQHTCKKTHGTPNHNAPLLTPVLEFSHTILNVFHRSLSPGSLDFSEGRF